jgi:putative membrane protein
MASTYLLLKTIHILAVISWMAGLLYLFRLYVYHRMESEAVVMERFRTMERRLWKAITVPAAWTAALTGMGMIWLTPCPLLSQGWFSAKLLLAALLVGMHLAAGHYRKRFLAAPLPLTEVAFRVLNEVPTLLMIGIVVLVEFQPNWGQWTACLG